MSEQNTKVLSPSDQVEAVESQLDSLIGQLEEVKRLKDGIEPEGGIPESITVNLNFSFNFDDRIHESVKALGIFLKAKASKLLNDIELSKEGLKFQKEQVIAQQKHAERLEKQKMKLAAKSKEEMEKARKQSKQAQKKTTQ